MISNRRGFSLAEVIVVVIVIAILASIAYPKYTKTMEIQRGREAKVALGLIVEAEKFYSMQTGLPFIDCIGTAGCNTILNLNLRSDNWDYEFHSDLGFPAAIASRTSGPYNLQIIVMDLNGVLCPAGACTWPYADFLE